MILRMLIEGGRCTDLRASGCCYVVFRGCPAKGIRNRRGTEKETSDGGSEGREREEEERQPRRGKRIERGRPAAESREDEEENGGRSPCVGEKPNWLPKTSKSIPLFTIFN